MLVSIHTYIQTLICLFRLSPRVSLLTSTFGGFSHSYRSRYPIRKLALILDLRRQYMATYAEIKRRSGGLFIATPPPSGRGSKQSAGGSRGKDQASREDAPSKEARTSRSLSQTKKGAGSGWAVGMAGWFYRETGGPLKGGPLVIEC